jgi:hypothetical protein
MTTREATRLFGAIAGELASDFTTASVNYAQDTTNW